MKKIFFAAVAAMFFGISVNAQSVNENEATVADVVAELNQADALHDIKEVYTDMFSQILVSEQNEVAMNSVSMEYFNNRIAK